MACGRTIRNAGLRRCLWRASTAVAGLVLLLFALAAPSAAEPLKTRIAVTTGGGYARLVFSASEYLDGSARVSGNVLIVTFKQPIDVSVDRINEQAPDFIAAARPDPDGKAVRMALNQTVTVNTMAAGEKFFVDLLPSTWSGVPPGLPQDVVDELARRARAAEEQVRRERRLAAPHKLPPIRVHVATQPTFTRYVFDAAGSDRGRRRSRQGPAHFEFRHAGHLRSCRRRGGAAEHGFGEMSSELDDNSALVRFMIAAKVDVRTFRDENGYVVDVVNPGADAPAAGPAPAPAQQSRRSESRHGRRGGVAPPRPILPLLRRKFQPRRPRLRKSTRRHRHRRRRRRPRLPQHLRPRRQRLRHQPQRLHRRLRLRPCRHQLRPRRQPPNRTTLRRRIARARATTAKSRWN